MNSPVAALGWEIWRKNRFGFALLLVLLLGSSALSWIAAHSAAEAARLGATLSADAPEVIDANARAADWAGVAGWWGGALFGLSLLVTLAVFAVAESNQKRGISGIPPRLFTMPVHTGQLVAVPTVTGACFIALLYFAWSRLVFAPIAREDARPPDGYFLFLLPAVLVAFQTLIWTLPGFPKMRATLLTLLVTTAAMLGALPYSELNRWSERKAALMTIYAVVLLFAPFVAWFGVTQIRKGEWRGWPALAALMDQIANAFSRRRDFPSPAAAQFWIERRRNGRLALGGLAAVILFVLGLNTFLILEDVKFLVLFEFVYVFIVAFVVWIWTPVLGLMMCGDVASRRLPLTPFQAARPVADGEFVVAKLEALIAVWLGGWMLAALSVIVWPALCGQADAMYNRFVQNSELGTVTIIFGAVSAHLLMGLFPLWLTGRVPGLPWSFAVLLIAYGGLGTVIRWFDRHSDYSNIALLLIGFAAALKLGLAFLGFRQTLKQKLARRGFVFGAVSVWVLGTVVFMVLMSGIAQHNNWNEALMLPFAALLFPIARVALAPVAMALNRHR